MSLSSSLFVDLTVSFFGPITGTFMTLHSIFYQLGTDAFTFNIPSSLKLHDYKLKSIFMKPLTWRVMERTGTEFTKRFHFLDYRPHKNHAQSSSLLAYLDNQLLFSDIIIFPIEVDLKLASNPKANELIDAMVFIANCSQKSHPFSHGVSSSSLSSSSQPSQHFVLVFHASHDEQLKKQLEDMISEKMKLEGCDLIVSVSSITQRNGEEREDLMDKLNEISDETFTSFAQAKQIETDNNSGSDSSLSFFKAQYFGMSRLPSFRNVNCRFALVRSTSASCSHIIKNETIVCSHVTNLGTTFVVEDFAPLFPTASSSAISGGVDAGGPQFFILFIKDADTVYDAERGMSIPFFRETLLDPTISISPKTLHHKDAHGNIYRNRSVLTPVIWSDLHRDRDSLLPPRLLFVEFKKGSEIGKRTRRGVQMIAYYFGGSIIIKCLDVQKASDGQEPVRAIFVCLISEKKSDPILLPSLLGEEENKKKKRARLNFLVTVSNDDRSQLVESCHVYHYVRQRDFAAELLNRVLRAVNHPTDSSYSAKSLLGGENDSFASFLESVLHMKKKSSSSTSSSTSLSLSADKDQNHVKVVPVPETWLLGNFLSSSPNPTDCDDCRGHVVGRGCSKNLFFHFLLQELFTDCTSMFCFSHKDIILRALGTNTTNKNNNSDDTKNEKQHDCHWLFPIATRTALTDHLDRGIMARNFFSLVSCIKKDGLGQRWLKEITASIFSLLTDKHVFSQSPMQLTMESSCFAEPIRTLIRCTQFLWGSGLMVLFGHCIYRGKSFINSNLLDTMRQVKIWGYGGDNMPNFEMTLSSFMFHCGRGNAAFSATAVASSSSSPSSKRVATILSPATLFGRILSATERNAVSQNNRFQGRWTMELEKKALNIISTSFPFFLEMQKYWMERFSQCFRGHYSQSIVGDLSRFNTLANKTRFENLMIGLSNVPLECVMWMYLLSSSRHKQELLKTTTGGLQNRVYLIDDFIWGRIFEYLTIGSTFDMLLK